MKNTPSDNQSVVEADVVEMLLPLSLTKKEWTVIYNCLVRQSYTLGNAMIVIPLADKLLPLVKEEHANQ